MKFLAQLKNFAKPHAEWWPSIEQLVYLPSLGKKGYVRRRAFKRGLVLVEIGGGTAWYDIQDIEKPPLAGEVVKYCAEPCTIVEVRYDNRTVLLQSITGTWEGWISFDELWEWHQS